MQPCMLRLLNGLLSAQMLPSRFSFLQTWGGIKNNGTRLTWRLTFRRGGNGYMTLCVWVCVCVCVCTRIIIPHTPNSHNHTLEHTHTTHTHTHARTHARTHAHTHTHTHTHNTQTQKWDNYSYFPLLIGRTVSMGTRYYLQCNSFQRLNPMCFFVDYTTSDRCGVNGIQYCLQKKKNTTQWP